MKKDDEISSLKTQRKEMIELRRLDEEYQNDVEEIMKSQTNQL